MKKSEQVEETLTKRCQEMEEEAKEQATDNAILEQIRKVNSFTFIKPFEALTVLICVIEKIVNCFFLLFRWLK